MLAKRVVPTLLFSGDQLIKGERFNGWRSVGHIRQAVELYATRGVDELIILDIGATPACRGPDFGRVDDMTNIGYTPITVGGGVRSTECVKRLMLAGADKVAIGTGCYEVADLLQECSDSFGSQAICMAIDVMGGNTVMTRCGKQGYNHSPEYTAKWAQRYGAGEILLTSIDREGSMQGYDLELIKQVSAAVDIPVIAHGGCSGPEDMLAAIQAGADAVAAGALFQFNDVTPKDCAKYLAEHGIEVRL